MGGFTFAWASPRIAPAQLAAFHVSVPVMVAIGLLYGCGASAAAFGLWRVASWGHQAIVAWGCSLFVSMIAFQAMIGVAGEPWWLVLLPYLVFGTLVFALFRYVQRRLKIIAPAI
jgi:hypothetical protein